MSDSLQPDGLQHMRLPCPSMLKVMSIESVMPSKHLTLCCSLVLLPSIFSNIRDFSNELALQIRWPNYCTFSFSISPPSEYSGLISFRIDWFNLLAVQGTLKNLLQHHNLICGSSVHLYKCYYSHFADEAAKVYWVSMRWLAKVHKGNRWQKWDGTLGLWPFQFGAKGKLLEAVRLC